MQVLLLGEGAALHTLAWKMVSEPAVAQLHCAPGNAGTTLLLGSAPFPSHHAAEIAQWAFARQVNLIVVQGRPEWVDTLTGLGLRVLGAGEREWKALRLRQAIRDRLHAHAVPVLRSRVFREREAAERYMASEPLPLWLRPNDVAEHAAVRVAERLDSFQQLGRLLGLYLEAGVCVEEEVGGPEVVLGLLCDGERAVSLGVSRPYDRRYEGATGPLTEGMGAYAPYGAPGLEARLMAEVGRPVVAALRAEGVLRPSFLHLRIVLGPAGPVLRDLSWGLDDLHAAVTLPRWPGACAELFRSAAVGWMEETALTWQPGIAVAVVVVVENYPGACPGGQLLRGQHQCPAMVWHHATRLQSSAGPPGGLAAWLRPPAPAQTAALPGQVLATGGRVLIVVGYAAGAYEACRLAYQGVEELAFEHSAWRRDIAAELL